jgi:hypothetical protein
MDGEPASVLAVWRLNGEVSTLLPRETLSPNWRVNNRIKLVNFDFLYCKDFFGDPSSEKHSLLGKNDVELCGCEIGRQSVVTDYFLMFSSWALIW